ncbi:F-actin-monooxygenase MICAL3-like isoform X2 [Penaeus monodon]|uniref:F-actin-monooxygenase MICAL3-like isoform X2 n=1 Tax=Penaeus monodon TaxID=6687 RepID=UPI0018A726BC|nr:F-actin-monooxygenase MICAL3-like isoform X2 [Penaeus monodon]
MVFVRGETLTRARGSISVDGMTEPKHDRDSDRESLTDWTLVDRDGTPEGAEGDSPQHTDEDEVTGATSLGDEEQEEEKESGYGMEEGEEEEEDVHEDEEEEEEEEEEDERLSDELISLGQRVQEIKASSGSDSSDIETLECPGPDDFYEDHALAYDSMHSSLMSCSLRSFTFVGDSETSLDSLCHDGTMVASRAVWEGVIPGEADAESLASTDISVLDEEKEKIADEETDLSLASSPSLPDDLPAIKPDTQYRHTPDRDLNSRLNIVVALTLACVLGLGLGHFLGWSSRSMWQDTLNSAQVRKLRELQDDLVSCMNSPLQPPPAPAPGFSFDTPQSPLMDTYPPEADLHESAYPGVDAPFVPVLPESEENLLIVESFVESLVTPLEDAGVVLSATRRKADMPSLSQGPSEGFGVATDPTFATPDLMRDEDFEASLSRGVAEDKNIYKEDGQSKAGMKMQRLLRSEMCAA